MATAAVYCPRCKHYRMRAQPELFSAADMQSTGGLKARLEWEQQQEQLRLLEQQRVEAGEVLPYEPHFYPWCAAASPFDAGVLDAVDQAFAGGDVPSPELAGKVREMASASRVEARDLLARALKGDYDAVTRLVEAQRATANPVTGDVEQTYLLCRRIIRRAQCPLFEPREG
jgi:hypothetical protein